MDMNSKTNEELLAEIDNRNTAIEAEAQKGDATDHNQIIQWRNEISMIQMTLSDRKTVEAQHQERTQAQEQAVESITLPLDFNDLLENPLANEMIIEVVKQFQRQAYEQHNVEIVRVNADWTDRVNSGNAIRDALKEQITGLHEDIQSLTNDLEGEKSMYTELETHNHELQAIANKANFEKADADTKRDNALHDLEQANAEITRLNGHVFDLQQQLANAPAPSRAIDIGGNDKLTELAAKAKESTIEKANRGLARWNLPAIEVPSMPAAETVSPPTMPEIPAAQEEHPKDAESTNTDVHSGGTEATEGNQAVHELVQPAEETTLTLDSLKAEIDALKTAHGTRLDRLDKQVNLPEVA